MRRAVESRRWGPDKTLSQQLQSWLREFHSRVYRIAMLSDAER